MLSQEDHQKIRELVQQVIDPPARKDAFVEFLESILPNIEQYRQKNVNKYYAEERLEHGGEYSVKEKYKNRVRIVDIFLAPLKEYLARAGSLPGSITEKDQTIP